MEIVICPDHNYIMPYGVMLHSLVSNNHMSIICYAVITKDVTERDKDLLRDIFEKGENIIKFVYARQYEKYNFPILPNSRFSKSAFFRLYLGSLLSQSVNKVLYLDGDIIVRHDITSLWNTNIDNYAAACITDQRFDIKNFNRLNYSLCDGYYNSGVMLINLKWWRNAKIEDSFNAFMKANPDKILVVDQDVSNYVLRGKILFTAIKYNVQEEFFWKREFCLSDLYKYGDEIEEAIKDPYILHFTGAIKPWFSECQHPLKSEFLKYLSETPWSGMWPKSKFRTLSLQHKIRLIISKTIRKIRGKDICRFREDLSFSI